MQKSSADRVAPNIPTGLTEACPEIRLRDRKAICYSVSGRYQGDFILFIQQPAAPPPAHPYVTLVDLIFKIAVALIGAAWAWLQYVRGRTFRRRLEPRITGEIFEAEGKHFLTITSSVKNVGLSRAFIIQRGTWIQISILQVDATTSSVAEPDVKEVGYPEVFTTHSWVEPGEEVSDQRLVQLPAKDSRDVAVRLDLRIISHEWRWPPLSSYSEPPAAATEDFEVRLKRDLGWTATAIVRYAQPDGSEAQRLAAASGGGC